MCDATVNIRRETETYEVTAMADSVGGKIQYFLCVAAVFKLQKNLPEMYTKDCILLASIYFTTIVYDSCK